MFSNTGAMQPVNIETTTKRPFDLNLLQCHQKIKFIPTKIHKTVATRAAPFGSDMHQIVCRLGLRPRPHWGSLQRSPRPPSWIKGAYF